MQSGSSRILKIMNRRYDKEKYLELVAKIRNAVPDISLTTDIIVGFREKRKRISRILWTLWKNAILILRLPLFIPKEAAHLLPKMENQVPEDVVKDRF